MLEPDCTKPPAALAARPALGELLQSGGTVPSGPHFFASNCGPAAAITTPEFREHSVMDIHRLLSPTEDEQPLPVAPTTSPCLGDSDSVSSSSVAGDFIRPFRCQWEDCDRAFSRKSDLVRHTRIHTNEKPFACPWRGCTKSFIQRSALKVHYRTHTGERPHTCEQCNRCFSDSSSLARHRRTHTGERPYACDYPGCAKCFTRKTSLRKHMEAHGVGLGSRASLGRAQPAAAPASPALSAASSSSTATPSSSSASSSLVSSPEMTFSDSMFAHPPGAGDATADSPSSSSYCYHQHQHQYHHRVPAITSQ